MAEDFLQESPTYRERSEKEVRSLRSSIIRNDLVRNDYTVAHGGQKKLADELEVSPVNVSIALRIYQLPYQLITAPKKRKSVIGQIQEGGNAVVGARAVYEDHQKGQKTWGHLKWAEDETLDISPLQALDIVRRALEVGEKHAEREAGLQEQIQHLQEVNNSLELRVKNLSGDMGALEELAEELQEALARLRKDSTNEVEGFRAHLPSHSSFYDLPMEYHERNFTRAAEKSAGPVQNQVLAKLELLAEHGGRYKSLRSKTVKPNVGLPEGSFVSHVSREMCMAWLQEKSRLFILKFGHHTQFWPSEGGRS